MRRFLNGVKHAYPLRWQVAHSITFTAFLLAVFTPTELLGDVSRNLDVHLTEFQARFILAALSGAPYVLVFFLRLLRNRRRATYSWARVLPGGHPRRWLLGVLITTVFFGSEAIAQLISPSYAVQETATQIRLISVLAGAFLASLALVSWLRLSHPVRTWKFTARVGITTACIAVLATVATAFVFPESVITGDLGGLSPVERVEAIASVRQSLLLVSGGIIAVVTLALSFSRQQLDRDSNRTDRYKNAVELLGQESSVAHIGGIHALGRLGQDSPRDSEAARLTLCAFIEERSVGQQPYIGQPRGPIPPDLRVAIESLGAVLGPLQGPYVVNLDVSGMDLSGIRIGNLSLSAPKFTKSVMRRAVLESPHLARASLSEADWSEILWSSAHMSYADATAAVFDRGWMPGAYLIQGNFTSASFRQSSLPGSNFSGADLTGADLSDATITEADFSSAILTRCNFSGANLSGANFTNATGWSPSQFDAASAWSTSTVWPFGYVPTEPERHRVGGN